MKIFKRPSIHFQWDKLFTSLLAVMVAMELQAGSIPQTDNDPGRHDGVEKEDRLKDGHEDHDHLSAGTDHGDEEEPNIIGLTAKQLEDFGVVVEEAGSRELSTEAVLPGEIKLNQENMAHVGPRYEGIVTKISARLGDKVLVGQILVELESNDTLAPFKLKAPIDGTIVDFHVTLGESVEAGRYLFIVANLDSVWVDLDIFQKDLVRIEKGQQVLVRTGPRTHAAKGIIDYVGPVVDKDSRTGLARIVLPNPDGRWKPGMFVTGYVTTAKSFVSVAVRKSALHVIDGQTVVFVEVANGFEMRPVIIGRQDALFAEILEGVEPGEFYASKRSFVVKAQMQKARIDPEAGHNH